MTSTLSQRLFNIELIDEPWLNILSILLSIFFVMLFLQSARIKNKKLN